MAPSPAPLSVADAAARIAAAGFGPQPPGVGIELEWFVVRDGRRLADARLLRDLVESAGPLPAGSRLTFEPGGQLEISSPCRADGPAAIDAARTDADAVADRMARAGAELVAIGTDPTGDRTRTTDEPRYRAMDEYFAARGHTGTRMMCGTASLQLNVGFAGPRDEQWRLAHDLAPVLAAMFAHSPITHGRPSGWQSTRLATWLALDPSRTRPVANGGSASSDWIGYALDAPVMLMRVGDEFLVPAPPVTLRDWLEHGHPIGPADAADVDYHLTTLFPPIRPRGWLELRMLDALPDPWWPVATAVTVEALAPAHRAAVARAVRGMGSRWLAAAWHGVHDRAIGDAAEALAGAVRPALDRYDASVRDAADDFVERYVRRRRSLADDRLDDWHARGRLHPPAPAPTGTR